MYQRIADYRLLLLFPMRDKNSTIFSYNYIVMMTIYKHFMHVNHQPFQRNRLLCMQSHGLGKLFIPLGLFMS
jgi:hypothetical protein